MTEVSPHLCKCDL